MRDKRETTTGKQTRNLSHKERLKLGVVNNLVNNDKKNSNDYITTNFNFNPLGIDQWIKMI